MAAEPHLSREVHDDQPGHDPDGPSRLRRTLQVTITAVLLLAAVVQVTLAPTHGAVHAVAGAALYGLAFATLALRARRRRRTSAVPRPTHRGWRIAALALGSVGMLAAGVIATTVVHPFDPISLSDHAICGSAVHVRTPPSTDSISGLVESAFSDADCEDALASQRAFTLLVTQFSLIAVIWALWPGPRSAPRGPTGSRVLDRPGWVTLGLGVGLAAIVATNFWHTSEEEHRADRYNAERSVWSSTHGGDLIRLQLALTAARLDLKFEKASDLPEECAKGRAALDALRTAHDDLPPHVEAEVGDELDGGVAKAGSALDACDRSIADGDLDAVQDQMALDLDIAYDHLRQVADALDRR